MKTKEDMIEWAISLIKRVIQRARQEVPDAFMIRVLEEWLEQYEDTVKKIDIASLNPDEVRWFEWDLIHCDAAFEMMDAYALLDVGHKIIDTLLHFLSWQKDSYGI